MRRLSFRVSYQSTVCMFLLLHGWISVKINYKAPNREIFSTPPLPQTTFSVALQLQVVFLSPGSLIPPINIPPPIKASGSTNFTKIQTPRPNSRRQAGCMKRVSYSEPTGSGVTCEPQCHLALSAQYMSTDKSFCIWRVTRGTSNN
jgi:hypothetical protein